MFFINCQGNLYNFFTLSGLQAVPKQIWLSHLVLFLPAEKSCGESAVLFCFISFEIIY